MILLDLFSGQGVGALGYKMAGFKVIGVDLDNYRDRYPGYFIQDDWKRALDNLHWAVDAIHASPPCPGYSVATAGAPHIRERYELLIPDVREALEATGKPYIIENVEGARSEMRNPITLCGTHFGLCAEDYNGDWLELRRHRLFESNVPLSAPGPCQHGKFGDYVGGVYGKGSSDRRHAEEVRRGGYTPKHEIREHLMGVEPGMFTQDGLVLGLPPCYTEHLGRQLLEAIEKGE